MIENAPHEQEQDYPDACFQCNSPDYEPGYAVRLCKTCRKRLSRYPLKKNIVLGAVGLGILFAFSLYRFKDYYKAAISYEKGISYADNRDFVSAEKAFKYILDLYPQHEASKVHLLTACYYNNKPGEALAIGEDLDKNPSYRYKDALAEEVATIRDLWAKNQQQNEDLTTASIYLRDNRLQEADSLLNKIARANPTNWEASLLLSRCLRQEKKYAEALSVCNHMLSYNHQLPAALAEKAILLKTVK
ncbi:tetratricopeptide repeat protein [Chitinophaga sp.]|uniref:tetratricopeptide repeat protein n=1 Tax=Chitinophaga sp. TaxID=1869181 RepID=UPI0031DAB2DC